MTIQISAFRWVPSFAQGYVRDLWVRWALEEAGLPYEAILIDQKIQASERYRAWQPFGQVPAFRDDAVALFESGAIVLHVATKSEALAPTDEAARARITAWVLAAMNSIDPHVQYFLDLGSDRSIAQDRRAQIEGRLKGRLESLSLALGDQDYLEGRFTAGDVIMGGVLRELVDSGILAAYPNLDAYRQRCEGRPAFAKAFEAQMRVFRENEPA